MVPSIKGRAIGIANQARTTSPREIMAPVRVPGTDTFPKLVSDAGRSFSIFRGLKNHLPA
jgi:hypothetical protein